MSGVLGRRDFVKLATLAQCASGQPPFQRMNAGTARVDITPDRPRICASGDRPDPPRAYARLVSRCLTLYDGQRRMAIVNYPLNCLDVATPILRVAFTLVAFALQRDRMYVAITSIVLGLLLYGLFFGHVGHA